MTTFQLLNKDTLEKLRKHPTQEEQPTPWTMPDGQTPPAQEDPYVYLVPESYPVEGVDYDEDIEKVVEVITATRIGWDIVLLTEQELEDRLPKPLAITFYEWKKRIFETSKKDDFKTWINTKPADDRELLLALSVMDPNDPERTTFLAEFKAEMGLTDEQYLTLFTP